MPLALALALALPAPAQAAHGSRPWSHVTRAPLPVPMPEIIHEACPGADREVAGCYFAPGNADETGRVFGRGAVFVVPGTGRYTKLHELGHAFDETMMDVHERQEWAHVMHRGDLLWTWADTLETGAVVQGFGTPAEAFADSYAACRMERTPHGLWEAGYDYYPTPRQHHRVCRVIARAARDAGTPVAVDGSR